MLSCWAHFKRLFIFLYTLLLVLVLLGRVSLLILVAIIISLLGIHAHKINLLLFKHKIIFIFIFLLTGALLVLVPFLMTIEPSCHLSLPLLPQLLFALFLLRFNIARGQQILPPLCTTLTFVFVVISIKLVRQSVKPIRLLGRLGFVPIDMSVLTRHSQNVSLQLQLPLLFFGERMTAPNLGNQILLVSQLSFQQFQFPLGTFLEVGTT
mmetsp:Transcript_39239/g.84635  ORF Transcript_39239/g.84635 Transcript_39239/m.84635 type:complete len:209 (-) Transcript_39239:132-758(-)